MPLWTEGKSMVCVGVCGGVCVWPLFAGTEVELSVTC